jgi:hypothetical protein
MIVSAVVIRPSVEIIIIFRKLGLELIFKHFLV